MSPPAESAAIQSLVTLSHQLGDPAADLVILGEGNTSTDLRDGTFPGEGQRRPARRATDTSFVRMETAAVMDAINDPNLDAYDNAGLDHRMRNATRRPEGAEAVDRGDVACAGDQDVRGVVGRAYPPERRQRAALLRPGDRSRCRAPVSRPGRDVWTARAIGALCRARAAIGARGSGDRLRGTLTDSARRPTDLPRQPRHSRAGADRDRGSAGHPDVGQGGADPAVGAGPSGARCTCPMSRFERLEQPSRRGASPARTRRPARGRAMTAEARVPAEAASGTDGSALNLDQRANALAAATTGVHDVVVIGAGATGAGAALDAAGRGLSVVLVEAGDLAAGNVVPLRQDIHGGCAISSRLNFRLVNSALARAQPHGTLLCPYLAEPEPFHLSTDPPAGSGRISAPVSRSNDAMTLTRKGIPHHRHFIQERRASPKHPPWIPADSPSGRSAIVCLAHRCGHRIAMGAGRRVSWIQGGYLGEHAFPGEMPVMRDSLASQGHRVVRARYRRRYTAAPTGGSVDR